VYLLDPDRALVQTVDFFTPIVDDPFLYGRIAAANALSDVYAMGGRPLTALNIACFPFASLDASVLSDILRGGQERLETAGCLLLGGHTVDDTELKYGLSITGEVHPERIMTNDGARPGDVLILTKPLGTGVVATAARSDACSEEHLAAACESMVLLNRGASEFAVEHGVRACTDITGFGLIGHAHRLALESGVELRITAEAVPLLPGALSYVEQGHLTAGDTTNPQPIRDHLQYDDGVPTELRSLFADPQTSGGLLICCPEAAAEDLMAALAGSDAAIAPAVIGEAVEGRPGTLVFA
jgi:selenide,water dikinase